MKHVFLFLSILLSISINEVFAQSQKEKNMELFRMMNDYRKLHGLSAINLNEKLQAVAEAHALDLEKYYDPTQKKCNLHSWSTHGNWSSCCYTDDHSKKECMWNKPKEIANYKGNGFEIAYYSSEQLTPERALNGWKKSPGHNQVILQTGSWKSIDFKSVGVFISEHYAVIWFGVE
jgi:uncharacterized protein YkwD